MKYLLLLCLVACGPDETPQPVPEQPAISSALDGSWHGATTYTISGLAPVVVNNAGVSISVFGDQAAVSNICPNGDGSVVVRGTGTDASWTGVLACTPVNAFTDCSNVTARYANATVSLYSGPRLIIHANGTATGCGTTRAFSATFDGTR